MNATVNEPNCSSPANPTAEKIGITSAYSLILLVSLVGNSFICIILYRTKTMRKPINFFIANMAISDLLFPTFLVPWILANLYADSWLVGGSLGQVLCKLSWFLPNVSTVVSVQSLVLIAVERFVAVVFPLRSPVISRKLCIFLILGSWLVSAVICSPYLFTLKLAETKGKQECVVRWAEAFGDSSSFAFYVLSVYVVIIFIPLTFLTMLYSVVLYKLESQSIPGEHSLNAVNQRSKQNRSVLKMAIAILVTFALCWTPISIVNLLRFFVWKRRFPCGIAFYLFRIISSFMAQANCAINPWICFICSAKYRQGLKELSPKSCHL